MRLCGQMAVSLQLPVPFFLKHTQITYEVSETNKSKFSQNLSLGGAALGTASFVLMSITYVDKFIHDYNVKCSEWPNCTTVLTFAFDVPGCIFFFKIEFIDKKGHRESLSVIRCTNNKA